MLVEYGRNMTSDGWIHGNDITGNNSFFQTQWVQCRYPISGSYGPAPRYIFYALIILSILSRKTGWITIAAVGSIMAYSATAAVHAVVLLIIHFTHLIFDKTNDDFSGDVLVEGRTSSGEPSSDSGQEQTIWVTVSPLVWDNDGDAVLVVIVTASLVFLPMTIWSSTLRNRRASFLIMLWTLVLMVGFFAALINFYFSPFASKPSMQLRFCPMDSSDTLPLPPAIHGPHQHGGGWGQEDEYRWNRTIASSFVHGNSSVQPSNTCIYPCLNSSSPLRDLSETYVAPQHFKDYIDNKRFHYFIRFLYLITLNSFAAGLTFTSPFAVEIQTCMRNFDFKNLARTVPRFQIFSPWFGRVVRSVTMMWIVVISVYTMVLSPITTSVFVIYMERYIWATNAGAESFPHFGQWGTLVTAALVLIAALDQYISPWVNSNLLRWSGKPGGSEGAQGPREWWRH